MTPGAAVLALAVALLGVCGVLSRIAQCLASAVVALQRVVISLLLVIVLVNTASNGTPGV